MIATAVTSGKLTHDEHHPRRVRLTTRHCQTDAAHEPPPGRAVLHAAYASSLDPDTMQRRAPHSPLRATGWLPGWRLAFAGEELGWEGAVATIVEAPPSEADAPQPSVFVALYEVSKADEDAMDEWEGLDLRTYRKHRVRVETMNGPQTAWVYVVDAYEGGLPSARYLGMLADAAEAAGAPEDYVAELRRRPCR